jgi:hypothetical protein
LKTKKISKCFKIGIKGGCWIYDKINIPAHVLIDFLHASLIGVMKRNATLWVNSTNSAEIYYISKILKIQLKKFRKKNNKFIFKN